MAIMQVSRIHVLLYAELLLRKTAFMTAQLSAEGWDRNASPHLVAGEPGAAIVDLLIGQVLQAVHFSRGLDDDEGARGAVDADASRVIPAFTGNCRP